MTPEETKLLTTFIAWCRAAADRVAVSKHPDEAVGLLRAAARLEELLKRAPRGE